MKALHVPVEGPAEVAEVDMDDVAAMQALVGGYFEVVVVPGALLWVDEDGRSKRLPVNQRATDLVNGVALLAGVRGVPIVGPVVLTGPADGRGGWGDVPSELVKAIQRAPGGGRPA